MMWLVNVVIRRRSVVIMPAIVLAILVGVGSLLGHRLYTSTALVMPQATNGGSGLSGLAADFGVTLSGADPSQSPDFYAEVLAARGMLESIVDKPYIIDRDSTVLLRDVMGVTGATLARRREVAIVRIAHATAIVVSRKTGVVTLSVTLPDPIVAREVAARYLDLLNQFNVTTRQSQATAERRFAGEQVSEAEAVLRQDEDQLQLFLERNRDYRNSPPLSFQFDRLSRAVAMQQQIFTALSQQYEQAKIQEVQDTPVLTVVQAPEAPVLPDSRHVALKVMAALILGGGVGALWALWRERVDEGILRADPELAAFVGHFEALGRWVRGPIRFIVQKLSRPE